MDDERQLWEQQLQADMQRQQSALQQETHKRLWLVRQQLEEQEHAASQQLRAEQESRLQVLRRDLQVRGEWWMVVICMLRPGCRAACAAGMWQAGAAS